MIGTFFTLIILTNKFLPTVSMLFKQLVLAFVYSIDSYEVFTDSDTFDVTKMWFGKTQVQPVNIRIDDDTMDFVVKDPTNSAENIILTVFNCRVAKTICTFERNATILFRILEDDYDRIRTKLELEEQNDDQSEPNGNQWIRIESHSLTDDIKERFNKVFARYDIITADEMKKAVHYFVYGKQKKANVSVISADHVLNYPESGTGAITIRVEDYKRLAVDEFLNDVIIDFYLEYLYREVFTSEQQEKTHIFSTFFYNVLSDRPPRGTIGTLRLNPAQKRHARVQKWTKDVNIFEKDFIIVPINKNSHWFLAIVCFPSLKGCVNMVTGQPIPDNKRRSNSSKSTRQSKRGNDDADDDFIAVKRPCILIFDSMSGEKDAEINIIRDYLNCERAVRIEDHDKFEFDGKNMPGHNVRVPHQPNISDCGLFLLQNVEQFFKDPIKTYELPIEDLKYWYETEEATEKRRTIAELIQMKMETQTTGVSVNDLPSIELP